MDPFVTRALSHQPPHGGDAVRIAVIALLFWGQLVIAAAEDASHAPTEKIGPIQADLKGSVEPVLSTERWPLVGKARLKVLFWEVYDSALYTPSGTWPGGGGYQLSLHYLRDIPASQLVTETQKAWRQQGRAHPNMAQWLEQLGALWPDIAVGDNLVFGVSAEDRNWFWFNGASIGGITDADFGPLFGGIWLDPETPRPALREELISSSIEAAASGDS